MIQIGESKMLFSGDANGKKRTDPADAMPTHVEAKLLALEAQSPGLLKAMILKVPHHGSESASTRRFMDAVDPRFVLFSSSTRHHLPVQSVYERYNNGGRVLLRTDANRENNRDHILCKGVPGHPLDCNYASVWNE